MSTKEDKVILRKPGENLDKYKILDDYLKMDCSLGDIAKKWSTKLENIEDIIRDLYKNFIKVKETRALLHTGGGDYYQILHDKYITPELVNREFLEDLSEPNTPYLSDSEVIFSHVLVKTGDSIKAIERSKLYQGIERGTGTNCKELMRLRSDYLNRKPNVSKYLQALQAEKLEILQEGKEYIQSNLIGHIEKLKARENADDDMKIIKALETLGRTVGAFDDKVTIDIAGGDSGLDRIMARAREAKVVDVTDVTPSKPMIAYSDGVEIYEEA